MQKIDAPRMALFLIATFLTIGVSAANPRFIPKDPAQDRHWDRRFGRTRGFTGNALAADGDRVYFGGNGIVSHYHDGYFEKLRRARVVKHPYELDCAIFTLALQPGDLSRNVYSPCPGKAGKISALAAGSNHELFAAGQFTQADGQPANNIAFWNGTGWNAMGVGIEGEVRTLTVSGERLIAGGSFTAAGGEPARNIALWNIPDRRWEKITGLRRNCSVHPDAEKNDSSPRVRLVQFEFCNPALPGDIVTALSATAVGFVAGGRFNQAGETIVKNIAQYSFSSARWSALGSGIDSRVVHALVSYHGDIYAVTEHNFIHWNGKTWRNAAENLRGDFSTACAAPDGLYLGGKIMLEMDKSERSHAFARWDGTHWQLVPGLTSGGIQSALMAGDRLYAAGWVYVIGDIGTDGGAYFQGGRWHPLTQGAVKLLGLDKQQRPLGEQLRYDTENPNQASLWLSVFDAGEWQPLTLLHDGNASQWHSSVVTKNGDIYFLSRVDPNRDKSDYQIAKWKGKSLAKIWSGSASVRMMTADEKTLCAILDSRESPSHSQIQCWDGEGWHLFADDFNSGTISDLSVQGNWLYAAGTFTAIDGQPAHLIARNNLVSRRWENLGASLPETARRVDRLKPLDGTMHIAVELKETRTRMVRSRSGPGRYAPLGKPEEESYQRDTMGLLQWNGSKWERLATQSQEITRVDDLAEHDGWLLIAGDVRCVDCSQIGEGIVAFKDGHWRAFGTGASRVHNIYPVPDGLILESEADANCFSRAGGHPSCGIAWWHGPVPPDAVAMETTPKPASH